MKFPKPTKWWHFAVIATILTLISAIVWNEALLLFVTSILLWIFWCQWHMGVFVHKNFHHIFDNDKTDTGFVVICRLVGIVALMFVIYNTHDIAVWIIYVIKGIPWVVWKVLSTITLFIVGFIRHSIWGS